MKNQIMKKFILTVATMCFFTQLFSQTPDPTVVEMTIVEKCSLSGHLTIPDNEIWECEGALSIATGTIIDGTGILIVKNKVTLSSPLEIKEGSFVRFDGGLILANGAHLINNGSLFVEGNVIMRETYNDNTCIANEQYHNHENL